LIRERKMAHRRIHEGSDPLGSANVGGKQKRTTGGLLSAQIQKTYVATPGWEMRKK